MKREGVFNREVYAKLEQIVKAPYPFITYEELNLVCNLGLDFKGKNSSRDRNILADILGTISEHESRKERPMLSAIVVLKNSRPPAPSFGFFHYARELGVLKEGEDEQPFYFRQLRELGIN